MLRVRTGALLLRLSLARRGCPGDQFVANTAETPGFYGARNRVRPGPPTEFDGHVLRLLQMTGKAKPARFANTSVDVAELLRLSRFLAEVAGERP